MSVIVFSSLKGGVGKTSLSINVAAGFARRGCKTLLIDLDPASHATGCFRLGAKRGFPQESPLARLFLARDGSNAAVSGPASSMDDWTAQEAELIVPLRPYFEILPGGAELRYFQWGQGPKAFITFFPRLVDELRYHYDFIIVDTPPEFNVLTRNAIAVADLVTVPVDSSGMSITSLEELVISAQHIEGPSWSICRTMVNRQASRIRRLSEGRLSKYLNQPSTEPGQPIDDEFMDMLRQTGRSSQSGAVNQNPIYLLRTTVSRTEEQNRLSFLGKTAFDNKSSSRLAEDYLSVARELETILEIRGGESAPEVNTEVLSQLWE